MGRMVRARMARLSSWSRAPAAATAPGCTACRAGPAGPASPARATWPRDQAAPAVCAAGPAQVSVRGGSPPCSHVLGCSTLEACHHAQGSSGHSKLACAATCPSAVAALPPAGLAASPTSDSEPEVTRSMHSMAIEQQSPRGVCRGGVMACCGGVFCCPARRPPLLAACCPSPENSVGAQRSCLPVATHT